MIKIGDTKEIEVNMNTADELFVKHKKSGQVVRITPKLNSLGLSFFTGTHSVLLPVDGAYELVPNKELPI